VGQAERAKEKAGKEVTGIGDVDEDLPDRHPLTS